MFRVGGMCWLDWAVKYQLQRALHGMMSVIGCNVMVLERMRRVLRLVGLGEIDRWN
jgi:hypothetical protein